MTRTKPRPIVGWERKRPGSEFAWLTRTGATHAPFKADDHSSRNQDGDCPADEQGFDEPKM